MNNKSDEVIKNALILEKKFNLDSLSIFLDLKKEKILKEIKENSFEIKKNGFIFKINKMDEDFFLLEFTLRKNKELIMLFFPLPLLLIRKEMGFFFLSIFTIFIANIYIYFVEKRHLTQRYLDLGFIVKNQI